MNYKPGGFCRNEDCICRSPGRICAQFIGHLSGYCYRCGWEGQDHPRKSLIHNGRKP